MSLTDIVIVKELSRLRDIPEHASSGESDNCAASENVDIDLDFVPVTSNSSSESELEIEASTSNRRVSNFSGIRRGCRARGSRRGGSTRGGHSSRRFSQLPEIDEILVANNGTEWRCTAHTQTSNQVGRRSQQNVLREASGPTAYSKRFVEDNKVLTAWRLFIDEPMLRHIKLCTETEARRLG